MRKISFLVCFVSVLFLTSCSKSTPKPYTQGPDLLAFEKPESFLCESLQNVTVRENELVVFGRTQKELVLRRRSVNANWSSPTAITTPDKMFLVKTDLRHTVLLPVERELQLLVYTLDYTGRKNRGRSLELLGNSGNLGDDWLVHKTGISVDEWNVYRHQAVAAGKTLFSLQSEGPNYSGAVSQDGGATWSALQGQLSLPSELKSSPRWERWQIMATEDGNPHLFVNVRSEDEAGVLHYRGRKDSEFNSVSWEPNVVVEAIGRNKKLSQHLYRLSRYSPAPESEQGASLVVSLSKDGGDKWQQPTTVLEHLDELNDNSFQIEGHGDTLVCTWLQRSGRDNKIFYSASQDGGQSWSKGKEGPTAGKDGYRLFVLENAVVITTGENRYNVYRDGRVNGFVDVHWATY